MEVCKMFPHGNNFEFHSLNTDWKTMHTHKDFWEFMLITSGSIMHKINGTNVNVTPNTLCVIRPDDVHAIYNKRGGSSSHLDLIISQEHIKNVLNVVAPSLHEQLSSCPPIAIPVSAIATTEIAQCAQNILVPNDDNQQEMNVLFLICLKEIIAHYASARNYSQYSKPVAELIQATNNPEKLKLLAKTLINESGYSVSYINKLFCTEMGMPFNAYLKNKKLEYAKKLLSLTDMSIAEIADQIGYMNSQNFSVYFKKRTGLSPRNYANLHRSLS